MLVRVGSNLTRLPVALGEAVSDSDAFWRVTLWGKPETGEQVSLLAQWARAPLFLLAALVVTGAMVLAKARRWIMLVFTAVSVGLVCTTPWPEQLGRYFTPLIPFLAIAAVAGLQR